MKTWTALLLTAIAVPTYADVNVYLHIGSKHGQNQYLDEVTQTWHDYESENYGLGLGYDLGDHYEVRIGGYRNSWSHASGYLAGNIHTDRSRLFSLELNAGLVSGYDNPILVLPAVRLNTVVFFEVGGASWPGSNDTVSVVTLTAGVAF